MFGCIDDECRLAEEINEMLNNTCTLLQPSKLHHRHDCDRAIYRVMFIMHNWFNAVFWILTRCGGSLYKPLCTPLYISFIWRGSLIQKGQKELGKIKGKRSVCQGDLVRFATFFSREKSTPSNKACIILI